MLDAMIKLAADQSTRNYQILEAVSQNVGNYNTWGYKAKRFELYLSPAQNVETARRVDFSQGDLTLTKRETDVSLDGPGFFVVTRPDGTTAYTRDGEFTINKDGMLSTPHGDLVSTGIQLPPNFFKLKINRAGQVDIMQKQGDPYKTVGQLQVASFNNPEGLKNIGYNLFTETDDSGKPVKIENPECFRQCFLERPNVDLTHSVVDMLRLNAGVIANLKVVKVIDEIYKEATQLRQ